MLEMAAQSGVRLDECTTGKHDGCDLSKMSRAAITWYILCGSYIDYPTTAQLMRMCDTDGMCLSPATSTCDRWGSRHGGKVMYFFFRSHHAWNGCRAYRECGIHHPVDPADADHTPLFTSTGSDAIQASFLRTVLSHMFKHDHMQPDVSKDRVNKYSFHSFRKFYTTGLKPAKVDVSTIQSLLRWSDPESVDGYEMPSPEDHAKIVDAA